MIFLESSIRLITSRYLRRNDRLDQVVVDLLTDRLFHERSLLRTWSP